LRTGSDNETGKGEKFTKPIANGKHSNKPNQ